jgi:EAL domain-containing protein (putative c-di-GMP-specific phosphodiesterase class I)
MLVKREDGQIVEAMIGLAHTLGLQTTAEGIESEAVRSRLVDLGCEIGQGFLFGAAAPKAERHVQDMAPGGARALA